MKPIGTGLLILAGFVQMSCASNPHYAQRGSCLTRQMRQFEHWMSSAPDEGAARDFLIAIRQRGDTIEFSFIPEPEGQSVGGGGSATYDCKSGRLIGQESYR